MAGALVAAEPQPKSPEHAQAGRTARHTKGQIAPRRVRRPAISSGTLVDWPIMAPRATRRDTPLAHRTPCGAAMALALGAGVAGLGLGCILDVEGLASDAPPCEVGSIRCDGICVDVSVTPSHCGDCGQACPNDEVCYASSCTADCPSGLAVCAGTCADFASNPLHCGECGSACPAGALCVEGACTCEPDIQCGDACVDVTQDPMHCGDCETACEARGNCVDGECTGPCRPGETLDCYTGPPGTEDVGVCVGGQRVCDENGQFGPCSDVTPATELCATPLDEDCDGISFCVEDGGLVARYYLDEADSGKTPTEALDAAPAPIDLTLEYMAGNEMTYTELPTGRGLRWMAPGTRGSANVDVDATKLAGALEGTTTMTVEIVARVDAVTNANSRILWIGSGNSLGRVAFSSETQDVIRFFVNDVERASFSLPFGARHVIHAVYDSALPTDKVKLYVDGAIIAPTLGTAPSNNETVNGLGGDSFFLGNRVGPDPRSFGGVLGYAAIYDVAFDAARVAQHASTLAVSDDAPP